MSRKGPDWFMIGLKTLGIGMALTLGWGIIACFIWGPGTDPSWQAITLTIGAAFSVGFGVAFGLDMRRRLCVATDRSALRTLPDRHCGDVALRVRAAAGGSARRPLAQVPPGIPRREPSSAGLHVSERSPLL